jgi:hypothetical protein
MATWNPLAWARSTTPVNSSTETYGSTSWTSSAIFALNDGLVQVPPSANTFTPPIRSISPETRVGSRSRYHSPIGSPHAVL